MIGRLKGTIIDKEADGAVIDVNGVGYAVSLPLNTLAALPPLNQEATLWIHTHVREEEFRLFGFETKQDRTAFRTLMKISGVGPKVALAVIGALSGPALLETVQTADSKRLSAIPGIGKKTAERMILELGGKLDFAKDANGGAGAGFGGVYAELDSALKNLGFKAALVQKVLSDVKSEAKDETSFEVLLRQSLALLRGK
ncbi:MAG: Holliday junction branch migration protein RuvA [Deltaproteobacteria bacterium]|nr:Holliday junction branch migration protein RuvA [Deltaproteobacteria bacterium]